MGNNIPSASLPAHGPGSRLRQNSGRIRATSTSQHRGAVRSHGSSGTVDMSSSPMEYTLELGASRSPLCCNGPLELHSSYASRDEALTKARFYRDRNVELAERAYLIALNFTNQSTCEQTDRFGEIEFRRPLQTKGEVNDCYIVRYGIGAASSCLGSCTECHQNEATEEWKKAHSMEAVSTAITSGTVSRLHSNDLDELVVNEKTKRGILPDGIGRDRQSRYETSDAEPQERDNTLCSTKHQRGEAKKFSDDAFRAEIFDELGQLYLVNGDSLKALDCFDKAAAIAPSDLGYLYRKGVVLQQLGRTEKAIDCFRLALATSPTYRPALFNLGVCLTQNETTRGEALVTFQRLASIEPSNVQALEMISHLHEIEGRLDDAVFYMQQVVALDPTNFRAARDLSRLEDDSSTRK